MSDWPNKHSVSQGESVGNGRWVMLLALTLASLAGAAEADAPAAAVSSPAQGRQAIYNQAQAAFDAGDWDKAITGFDDVLAKAPRNGRPEAIIRSRLAEALLNTGRIDEAQTQATRAVEALRGASSGPDADLASAYLTLGDVLRANLSDDAAIQAYEQAQVSAAGEAASDASLQAAIGVIQSAMVTHPDLAVSTADGLISSKSFAAYPRDLQAQILSLRARAELNHGDARGAQVFIDRAVKLSGPVAAGKVTMAQVIVRSDAALIYARLNDDATTREFLAYSGSGRLPTKYWLSGADIEAPVCGPEMAPEDTAVVEFAIGADGRTLSAAPVYSSRPGQTGVEFARAVREWRWRPEAVAKLDAFWRSAMRFQLRCATRPPPLGLNDPFYDATRKWLLSKGVSDNLRDLAPEAGDIASAPAEEPESLSNIPILFRRLPLDDASRLAADAAKLNALLIQAGAPVEARAVVASLSARTASMSLRGDAAGRARILADLIPTFDALAGGEHSAAWLRVELAVALETSGDFAQASKPLETVVALPPEVLASDDPIRSVAILHLSLLDRRAGNPAGALARLNGAGLTEQKCDLLDVRPVPTNRSVSADEFPAEAQKWGFEGFVRAGFDIAADGSVKQVRALISYPPFVFGDATEKVLARFRYLPPTLGDTSLGCTGQTLTVNYVLPGIGR